MRKHVIMLSLLTIFIFGCSQNEERTVTEPVNSVLTQASFKKQVESLTTNVAFKKAISDRLNESNTKSGKLSTSQGNGTFVIQDDFGVTFGFFGNGKIIFVGSGEKGTIRFLPNGLAHFQNKTDGPYCDVFDSNFNSIYSNGCYGVRTGSYYCNFISAYEKYVFDYGGRIITYYIPTELQSSSVLNMNTTISNGLLIFNDEGLWVGCTDATEEKNISIQYVKVGDSKANRVIKIDLD